VHDHSSWLPGRRWGEVAQSGERGPSGGRRLFLLSRLRGGIGETGGSAKFQIERKKKKRKFGIYEMGPGERGAGMLGVEGDIKEAPFLPGSEKKKQAGVSRDVIGQCTLEVCCCSGGGGERALLIGWCGRAVL